MPLRSVVESRQWIPAGRRLKIALPILVCVAAIGIAMLLAGSRERPAANPPVERVWPVETANVSFSDVQPTLTLYGEVVAGREVELRAAVDGPVIRAAETLVAGGVVRAGEEILAIDPFDHEMIVAEREASHDEARARLAELNAALESEQGLAVEDAVQVEISERDLARRRSLVGNAVSERGLDEARAALSRAHSQLIQRMQGIAAREAQIAQQEAVVARSGAALERALRALADTVVRAPFDGYVAEPQAQVGKRLRTGDRIARLIDADSMEVRFHLPDAVLGRVLHRTGERTAKILWRLGPRTLTFDATVDRIDSEIDARTGGIAAYARVRTDSDAASGGIRPGAFVEVQVADQVYRHVVRLPEAALHGGGTVYAVEGERLEARLVEVLSRDGADVLVSGELSEGDAVVVTRLTEIGPGLRVSPQ